MLGVFVLAMNLAFVSGPDQGSTAEQAASSSVSRAYQALAAAEQAARDSKESAEAARRAAMRADEQLAEARRLLRTLTAIDPAAPPRPPVVVRPDEDKALVAACPDDDIELSSVQYFRIVDDCERRVLAAADLNQFRARSTTGVGTRIAAASAGAAATFTLENVQNWRSVNVRPMGRWPSVEQQRVSRRRTAIGIRADITKDDKNFASVATFGELDRLTSRVALFARYGRDYSTSEAFEPFTSGGTYESSFIRVRAEQAQEDLEKSCAEAKGADCTGLGLVRWIFDTKAKTHDFANPAAVKAYNSLFWQAPPTDAPPRYGWLVRGEVSRPTFDYYPFVLSRAADPFRPGRTKTVIDPASFPADFASRIVTNDDRINFSITGRAFFHVSPFRTGNAVRNTRAYFLSPFARRTAGTTFIGSGSFVRTDEIEKQFRDVQICPPPAGGAAFVTSQTCTTTSIAGPTRKDSFVAGLEVRQGFQPMSFIPPTMLSAKITHDFESRENGLVVPIYFAADATDTFTGGLRFAHVWGGRGADGSLRKPESILGVVVGLAIGVDGTTGID